MGRIEIVNVEAHPLGKRGRPHKIYSIDQSLGSPDSDDPAENVLVRLKPLGSDEIVSRTISSLYGDDNISLVSSLESPNRDFPQLGAYPKLPRIALEFFIERQLLHTLEGKIYTLEQKLDARRRREGQKPFWELRDGTGGRARPPRYGTRGPLTVLSKALTSVAAPPMAQASSQPRVMCIEEVTVGGSDVASPGYEVGRKRKGKMKVTLKDMKGKSTTLEPKEIYEQYEDGEISIALPIYYPGFGLPSSDPRQLALIRFYQSWKFDVFKKTYKKLHGELAYPRQTGSIPERSGLGTKPLGF